MIKIIDKKWIWEMVEAYGIYVVYTGAVLGTGYAIKKYRERANREGKERERG